MTKPSDHTKLTWVIRAVGVLVTAGFVSGTYVTSLAKDVESNTRAIETKASKEEFKSLQDTLNSIASLLQDQDERQREMAKSLAKLEERSRED